MPKWILHEFKGAIHVRGEADYYSTINNSKNWRLKFSTICFFVELKRLQHLIWIFFFIKKLKYVKFWSASLRLTIFPSFLPLCYFSSLFDSINIFGWRRLFHSKNFSIVLCRLSVYSLSFNNFNVFNMFNNLISKTNYIIF